MSLLATIKQRASDKQRHIILPEGDDARVQAAALTCMQQGLARITLLHGDELDQSDKIALSAAGVVLQDHGEPQDEVIDAILARRAHKGVDAAMAKQLALNPLINASTQVQLGWVDGCVAGAVNPTADVVRSALQFVGMAAERRIVSSYMLMEFPQGSDHGLEAVLFADCGLVVAPDPQQLAEIAIATAQSARQLLDQEPIVALLSFSTHGSAQHELVSKSQQTLTHIKEADANLKVMGEIQFDAAINSAIRAQKAPSYDPQDMPNVFIFPDLNAGNIGYKLVQRLANASATGPILQGLQRPINDLSRGCSEQDIINACCITALQSH